MAPDAIPVRKPLSVDVRSPANDGTDEETNTRIVVTKLKSFMIWLMQNESLQSTEIGGNCLDL